MPQQLLELLLQLCQSSTQADLLTADVALQAPGPRLQGCFSVKLGLTVISSAVGVVVVFMSYVTRSRTYRRK